MKYCRFWISFALILFIQTTLISQPFGTTFTFTNVTTSTGITDPTPVPELVGLKFSQFKYFGPSVNPNAGGRFSFVNWSTGATNGSNSFTGVINLATYYEITAIPDQGFAVDLASIAFTMQRSSTGIRQFAVRSSIDNFQANLPASISPANANLTTAADNVFTVSDDASTAQSGTLISLTSNAFKSISTAITFRIYGWNAEAATGSFGIDDFAIRGTIKQTQQAPTGVILSSSVDSIVFLPTILGTTSGSQSYKLFGSNLTERIRVDSYAPASISFDNVNFTYFNYIDANDPELTTGKTIFVRFYPQEPGKLRGFIRHQTAGADFQKPIIVGEGLHTIELHDTSYYQDFDTLGDAYYNNFRVGIVGITPRTGATANSLGTVAPFIDGRTLWSNTAAGFKDIASGDLDEGAPQAAARDRAFGIRQTGSFGDPGASIVFQVLNTINRSSFTLDFKLQSLDASSPRTTTWKVEYGIGSNPTTFFTPSTTGNLVTGGNNYSSNNIHVDFGDALDNINDFVTIRIVALAASTGSGNRATTGIDDFMLKWKDPSAKNISLSTTAIAFPATAIDSGSIKSYKIVRQANLTQPIIITAPEAFLVSLDSINFSSSISVPVNEATNKTVFIKFTRGNAGTFEGLIVHSSVGAVNKTIRVTGEVIDPAELSFNFNICSIGVNLNGGFKSVNVTGSQSWACTQYGRTTNSARIRSNQNAKVNAEVSSNGVDINGFANGTAQTNDAWLVSPAIHLNNITNIPVLSFYSRAEFSGPSLQLLVSTTYDGTSIPVLNEWTELNGFFPTPSGSATTVFTLSDNIDLSAYKNAPKLYIAFRYTSSPSLGAARWTLDDIAINDQSTLITAAPNTVNFGEVAVGNSSAATSITVKTVGGSSITLTPSAGYEISADNVSFSNSPLILSQAVANAGTIIYSRFTPSTKALKVDGTVIVTAPGLNKTILTATASSYPKSETLDIACYNISFFGSNSTNKPTPSQITTQINNVRTVMQRLNSDVIAIEELSSDSAFGVLLSGLPGYQSTVSNRWSYSFNPPDPDFPPQKIGFIYNASTMTLSTTEPPRAMFVSMYDSARLGLPGRRLTDYPTGTASSFWSSGRLPYMATFNTTLNGISEKIRFIVLHAKSGGALADYTRRQYDVKLLKDSLDAMYPTDKIVILGDYNDRMVTSIYAGNPTSYLPFLNDNANYSIVTLPLDQAGKTSFPTGTGMIDHITLSNELAPEYIATSTDIEDARTYIAGYNATTGSDHLPVFARFSLVAAPLPVRLADFTATPVGAKVDLGWTTVSEINNSHFIIERSTGDANHFVSIGKVNGAGTSSNLQSYQFIDESPVAGYNFYRLKQVDIDGKFIYSNVLLVQMGNSINKKLIVYPNPVTNFITLNVNDNRTSYDLFISNTEGKQLIMLKGNVPQLNTQLTNRLASLRQGWYIVELRSGSETFRAKIIKQ